MLLSFWSDALGSILTSIHSCIPCCSAVLFCCLQRTALSDQSCSACLGRQCKMPCGRLSSSRPLASDQSYESVTGQLPHRSLGQFSNLILQSSAVVGYRQPSGHCVLTASLVTFFPFSVLCSPPLCQLHLGISPGIISLTHHQQKYLLKITSGEPDLKQTIRQMTNFFQLVSTVSF